MDDAKHTPGPWGWVYADPRCRNPIALAAHGEDVLLCTGDESAAWGVVSPADADLIASAPDLLDACEATLAQLDYLTELWGQEGVTRTIQDRLRAAVARAKGG